MKSFIQKHQFLPTEGGMDAGADKLIDGRLDGRTDGQRDGHRNEQGRTDRPSFSDGVTHEDDSMDLFDHM